MFDFDATLPLMALQFILLAVILNAVFYKPLGKVLDERAEFLRVNGEDTKEKLAKTEALTKEYELQLAEARKQSQAILATAQAEAQKLAAQNMAQAQAAALAQKEAAALAMEQEKASAMQALEQQVDALSRQILEKLVGAQLVK
jgi:F-type H+-transporting ATPase subunit b